jgi:pimeloyl-ACP methyl ester carboxylesterase
MVARTHRALAALALFVTLAAASPDAARPYLHPQRLVAVGDGRRMNLYCTGSGSPTVVLGTDGDDATPAWRLVQPILARTMRVCSYDAEGIGFSDPVTGTLDAARSAGDLHALLAGAGVRPPFVLVGYSLSGLAARLYADRYPREVAGMVLVTPNIPYQAAVMAKAAPALAAHLDLTAFLQRCTTAAERGLLKPGTSWYGRCVYTPPDPTLPASVRDLIHRQWARPGLWRSFSSAMNAGAASSAEVVAEQRSYGRLPLVVLTTTKDIAELPIPAAQRVALTRAWLAAHRAIAQLSDRGVDIVVPGAHEAIPIERPDVVVAAVRRVAAEALRP